MQHLFQFHPAFGGCVTAVQVVHIDTVIRNHPDGLAVAADMDVAQNRKQPRPQWQAGFAQGPAGQGPLDGILHKIIGMIRVPRQRHRKPAKMQDAGLDFVVAFHGPPFHLSVHYTRSREKNSRKRE